MRRSVITRLLIAVIILATGVPALAHDMDGAGSPTNDWGEEHLLCRPQDCSTEVSSGNVVGVWQAILYVETYLAECGSAGVDGVFGTGTKNATKDLQDYWNLTVDGKVGSQSWGRADNNLVEIGDDIHLLYEPDRSSNDILLHRIDGDYEIIWRNYPGTPRAARHTDHPGITVDVC